MLANERVWLDRSTLRVSFGTDVACLACAIVDPEGNSVRRAPTLKVGADQVCRIDLTGVAPGIYRPVVLTARGPIDIGASVVRRHASRAPGDRKPPSAAVAQSTFPGGEGTASALLYADRSAGGLRLRLSVDDDAKAFLAALERPATAIRFSVISPCYNVARYLDDFFESIVNQSLDFRQHIELIAVDDGSTDRSAKILKRWQRKYPDNIHYFRKENGGPASARNFGLARAAHEWITFIDSDDFVDRNYFAEVAAAIGRHGEDRVAMVSCNLIRYYEAAHQNVDNHPLRFRFAHGEAALPAADLGRFIQLASNCAFVRKSLISETGLTFDGRIRPSFEDAHFNGRYLIAAGKRLVVFVPTAKYFYRQRADQSLLGDATKTHPEWYGDQLQYGSLALLSEMAARSEVVPRQVQYTVLYDLLGRFRHVLDRPEVLSFLGDDRQQRFRQLLDDIFRFVEVEAIIDYDVTKPEFSYKVGLLNLFKDCDPPQQLVEITALDETKGLTRMVCRTRRPESGLSVRVEGVAVPPAYSKRRRRDFMGETFCWEHICWAPVGNAGALAVRVDGQDATVRLRGRDLAGPVSVPAIRAAFAMEPLDESCIPAEARELRRLARSPEVADTFRDAWLFMDRDTEADDNAEHLYRWVRKHYPEINAFFILAGDAPHWTPLASEGFRMLTFNAPEHALALLNAKYVISSHVSDYVFNRLPQKHYGDVVKYKCVFLQHGVIKDDLSRWLNKRPVDLFITTTPSELEFISGDGPFVFSRKEVVLTGLPRHDALLEAPLSDRRVIVFMPTWRSTLVGPTTGISGNIRRINAEFAKSEYAKRWKSILQSDHLAAAIERAGYRVVFVPHKDIEIYLEFFDLPAQIEIRRLGSAHSIQRTFRELSLLVTDYTSAAFDVAYLLKPVIYYQFDRDFVFGGGHLYRRGYFDYERDGFGPVFTEEDDLIAAIAAFMEGTPPDPIYRQRAEKTFPFRDGKCCERVFNAILNLGRHGHSTERTEADFSPSG